MKRQLKIKPWGKFERFTLNEKSTVKILTVKPKQILSLQYHHKRSEFWRILEGKGIATVGNKQFKVKEGDEIKIPKKTKHTLEATTTIKVLEIASGTFDEKDIVRLKDKYGRK